MAGLIAGAESYSVAEPHTRPTRDPAEPGCGDITYIPTGEGWLYLAENHGVILSHGRTGQCWDNALAESFFSAIKGELLDDHAWPDRTAARHAVTGYIAWYNGTRLHLVSV